MTRRVEWALPLCANIAIGPARGLGPLTSRRRVLSQELAGVGVFADPEPFLPQLS